MHGRPLATYRLQLGTGLDFAAAAELVPYLAALGVSHLYLSPVLTARTGSTHGYDVVDPARVAPALGGEVGLRRLAAVAAEAGLGLVADLVPNHQGVGPDNPRWEALLAEGQSGPAGSFFDVDWASPLPGAAGKVILPVLGSQYGQALVSGELRLADDGDSVRLHHHDRSFPLSPESLGALERSATLASLRGEPGEPESWARLHGLLESQHYRLVHWRAGNALVNYRRFFAIDELAAVRVEDEEVFEQTHAKIVELVRDGVLQGLRIDHPDGLRDPRRYFERLAERTGGVWAVAEKILQRDETLPAWEVAGTTGYEFANDVLGLFVDPGAASVLGQIDESFGAPVEPYEVRALQAKRTILSCDLTADLRRLGRRLWDLTQEEPGVRDVDDLACAEVVARTLQALDVYRTYVDPETGEAGGADRERIRRAVERAQRLGADGWTAGHDLAPAELYRFFGALLCGEAGTGPEHRDLTARFQQLSGAVMAKGVEDTALYRHQRLVAVNEVGGDPTRLGVTVDEFHARNLARADRHPAGMLTTATHDMKRGEDVRLRIAALSELAGRWAEQARRWRAAHAGPDPQTELLLYQSLVGVWPLDDPNRVVAYLVKACREAGLRTSWTDPDAAFEQALERFVDALLGDPSFVDELTGLAAAAHEIAMVAGLAQTLLRCTGPGVPDTYQGTELWEGSLVDPDNRRPVDFAARAALLADLDAGADPGGLWAERWDGRVKLWVLSRALRARRAFPQAVAGAYVPLETSGAWAEHLVAYARRGDGQTLVVVAPRLPGRVMGDELEAPLGPRWADTRVRLPGADRWEDRLTGRRMDPGEDVAAADLLTVLPVALLAPPS